MELLKSIDRKIQRILYWLTIIIFFVLGALLLLNVKLRLANDFIGFLTAHGLEGAAAAVKKLIPLVSFHWFDEIVEMCFAGLVFYGAAALWAMKGHFCVGDFISRQLPGDGARALYKTVVTLVSFIFLAVFFRFSLRLALNSTELTTVFQIPKAYLYACMPISSFIMLLYSLAELTGDLKRLLLGGGGETATGEAKSL